MIALCVSPGLVCLNEYVFTHWLCLSDDTSHEHYDNLINKRGTFDDSQVSTAEADIRVIVSQKAALKLGR